MTEDAIVSLIERTTQASAMIGQRKSVTAPDTGRLDGENAVAVLITFLRARHQILGMDIMRFAKQDVVAMCGLPGSGVECPCRITFGDL